MIARWSVPLVLLCAAEASFASVKVERINYKGWTGSLRMSNGRVDLVYVPSIGRIMRFGFVGKKNMLWNNKALLGKTVEAMGSNEWINYGGDKLWPAPQSNWSWPPDHWLDGSPHKVTVRKDNSLEITSPTSKKLGIQFIRTIVMDPKGPKVSLVNTMVNRSKLPVEWSVWEIAQVDDPDYAAFQLNPQGYFADGYYTFDNNAPAKGCAIEENGRLIVRRSPAKTCKVGSDHPDATAFAGKGGTKFVVSTIREPNANYPDDGCSIEVYTNNDPLKYMELEMLGPVKTIPPGKTAVLNTWLTLR